MALKNALFGFALIAAICMEVSPAISAPWIPPIGIPAPSFGMNDSPPALPNPWTAVFPDFTT